MRLSLRIAAVAIAAVSATSVSAETLEKVVILSRHGVRSAMSSPERLEEASARPWPRFAVPAGHLTARGETLIARMGDYYRQHYIAQGLLKAGDCSAVYTWANVTQRTIATGKAYAAALAPGCPVVVNTVGEGNDDPMFEPVKAGIVKADHALARAAVAGRVGGDLSAWSASHRQEAEQLDALLMQCAKGPCPAAPGKRRVFDAKPGFVDGEDLAGVSGPEAFASGVTESLLMAWADGGDFAGLGWKGLDEEALTRAFFLHQAEFDLRLRTPYVARVLAGRLLRIVTGRPEHQQAVVVGFADGRETAQRVGHARVLHGGHHELTLAAAVVAGQLGVALRQHRAVPVGLAGDLVPRQHERRLVAIWIARERRARLAQRLRVGQRRGLGELVGPVAQADIERVVDAVGPGRGGWKGG